MDTLVIMFLIYSHLFSLAGIFKETFKSLGHVQPAVLYPIPDFNGLNKPVDEEFIKSLPQKPSLFLSINRYEKKKNISLAVMAFGKMSHTVMDHKNFVQ